MTRRMRDPDFVTSMVTMEKLLNRASPREACVCNCFPFDVAALRRRPQTEALAALPPLCSGRRGDVSKAVLLERGGSSRTLSFPSAPSLFNCSGVELAETWEQALHFRHRRRRGR